MGLKIVVTFQAREEEEEAERVRLEEEQRREREELERFEKKMEGKKKRRNRRRQSELVQESFLSRNKLYIGIFLALLLSFGGYFVLK